MTNGTIRLEGLTLYGYHGALEVERRLGQKLELDLELTVDLSKAAASDQLQDTVNYETVYEIVSETVENERFHLLEALADTICRRILSRLEVERVKVRIGKNALPFPNQISRVEIALERGREKGGRC
jgi:dihydroneopterin aldolase